MFTDIGPHPSAAMPKLLILTCRFGMGHYSAAASLAQDISSQNPNSHVMICDIYEKAFPRTCPAIYEAYSLLAGKGWAIYNLAYKKTTACRRQGDGADLGRLRRILLKALSDIIEEFQPDMIISTYSLCSMLTSCYKAESKSAVPLITYITDITSHNVWINDYTDYYFVADKTTRLELIGQGVSARKIVVSGIPVKKEFKKLTAQGCASLETAGKNSGTQTAGAQKRELLVMGGGLGLLPESRDFYVRLNGEPGLHTTVITGKNRRLYRKLAGRYENITVLGYTDEVYRHMSKAHLLLSKPGGITLFEAVYAGLPLASFTPLLKQEMANGAFIRDKGLGILLDKNPAKAAEELIALLKDRQALAEMQKNMKQLKAGMQTGDFLQLLASLEAGSGYEENGIQEAFAC